MADFMASNEHLQKELVKEIAKLLEKNLDLENMLWVKEIYLKATFDEINSKYGNVQNFLTKELGVDKNKMKELYLEK